MKNTKDIFDSSCPNKHFDCHLYECWKEIVESLDKFDEAIDCAVDLSSIKS